MELVGGLEELKQQGVGSRDFALTRFFPNGKTKRIVPRAIGAPEDDDNDNSNGKTANGGKTKTSPAVPERFWIPRSVFVSLLYEMAQKHFRGKINVHLSTECLSIEKRKHEDASEETLEVVARRCDGKNNSSGGNELKSFSPNLLVGCDGLNSVVRKALVNWDGDGQ